MATKRLIDANALIDEIDGIYKRHYVNSTYQFIHDFFRAMFRRIHKAPTVDAVPVDEFRLHHILIDNEGVPEVKLQFGDRYVTLRTDPVDVRQAVHGRWNKIAHYPYYCSVCDEIAPLDHCGESHYKSNYCPNCGAKMDGDGNA